MTSTHWPRLDYTTVRPTADHLHRLAQIGGKYAVDQTFEPNWGNVVMPITPRGFATPTLYADGVAFTVEYQLLDDLVAITADTGRAHVALAPGSVADFLAAFTEAAASLHIPALTNLSQPEIAGAPQLDQDTESRPYDPGVARAMAETLQRVNEAFNVYQAPFWGHRLRVGLMWGGFDLATQRFNGRSLAPPSGHPPFLRNGMTAEAVAVGFTFGDERSPTPAFYAYISPPPVGIETAAFGVADAFWADAAGLVVLPWEAVRSSRSPAATVVEFADAVYKLAEATGRWPADLLTERVDGRYASTHPVHR